MRLSLTMAGLILFSMLLTGAAPSSGEDTADLVLTHGKLYPVEPAGLVEGERLHVRKGGG